MDKVVVFGGSGFIGSHVADELTFKGYDVVIFDKIASRYLQKNQTMVIGDLLDRQSILEVVEDAKYVYHFGGIADIEEATRTPWETMYINVMGTCAILEACAALNIERFLFASSMYVYTELGSFYRVSKQSCEKLIKEYSRKFGLGYTVFRIGTPYGPRSNHFNSIRKMLIQAFHQRKLTCYGSPDEVREYIHVSDAAQECVSLLDDMYHNQHVIMTGNQSFRLDMLAKTIREMLGNDIDIEYLPRGEGHHYHITPYSYKPEKAIKVTPMHYHDLGQGLLELLYELGGRNSGRPIEIINMN
ncbi:MAG: NAD(P)-dependent oxidoreductase [Desulfamplus sp.]|nr:NAD(P)-dependent oxidoreductase [Desulfamplus sp.]